eukprot:COSAG02_NODE_123_length_35269_cov_51.697526_26_plen_62_part_00
MLGGSKDYTQSDQEGLDCAVRSTSGEIGHLLQPDVAVSRVSVGLTRLFSKRTVYSPVLEFL